MNKEYALLEKSERNEREKSYEKVVEDSLKLYMDHIGAVPLLSFEEERRLAWEIKQGDKAAKLIFIMSNLRLVVSVANKYKRTQMPILDLIQEGNLGLIKAVEKFDFHKGFKFSTYAIWWVRHAIEQAITDKERLIRLPTHVVRSLRRWKQTSHLFLTENGREPEPEEMVNLMNICATKILQVKNLAERQVLSLDFEVGEVKVNKLKDIIEATNESKPDEVTERNFLKRKVDSVLNTLAEREETYLGYVMA